MSHTADLTAEQYVQLEAAICKYIEEHPDVDVSNPTNAATIRRQVADAIGFANPVKLVKPYNAIVRKLTESAAEHESQHSSSGGDAKGGDSKSGSTKPKINRRSVDVDPKSQSASDSGAKPAQPRKGRQPRGAVPAKDDIDGTTKTKGGRKPASANKANAEDDDKSISPLANTLDGDCCTVDGLPYNFIADPNIEDFADDPDFKEAIREYFQILVPNIAEELFTKCMAYNKTLRALHEKYPTVTKLIDGKTKKAKPQQFKYVHPKGKAAVVKYTNPDDLKIANLNAAEAKPIIAFNEYLDTVVANELPAFSKPKGKKDEDDSVKLDWIGLLNSKVIHTSVILGAAWYKKLIPNADAKFVKPLGFFLHEGVPSEDVILGAIKSAQDIDYVDLFKAIAKVPSAKMPAVTKNIYLARHRLSGKVLDPQAMVIHWIQAMNNILGITDEAVQASFTSPIFKDLITDDDIDIIHTWQNVMTSRFVYYITARGAPANPIFEKAFLQLITHPTSIKLYMTALYPIACYFTPFHCYLPSEAFTLEKFPTSATPVAYYKHIKTVIATLMTSEGYDITTGNWTYYLSKDGLQQPTNLMIALLGPYILAKGEKKTEGAAATADFMKSKKGGKKGGKKEASEGEDEDEDEKSDDEDNDE